MTTSTDRLDALRAVRFALPSASTQSAGPGGSPSDQRSTIDTMLDHRTCRHYTDRAVDDSMLDVILAATFSTPSKSDLQQCSVIVVDDPGRRAAIAELIPSMPWVAESPRFLVFCGDSRRIRQVTERAGQEFANDHLDAVLNAAADAAMHLSSFIWAAESLGLGTCPISVVRNHIEEVSAILELPNHVFPLAGMCVGWPAKVAHISPRLPLEVTVHHDRYDDHGARELIDDYDHRRYGGWSSEKAEMVARRERDQLARFLRSQGFDLD